MWISLKDSSAYTLFKQLIVMLMKWNQFLILTSITHSAIIEGPDAYPFTIEGPDGYTRSLLDPQVTKAT